MTTVSWKSHHSSSHGMPEKRRAVVQTIGWQVRLQPHVWSPPTDLYETESNYTVRVEIAGMREQDFSVSFDNNYLTISGSRPDLPDRRAYHQMEVRFGQFSTVVALPGSVDAEKASAEYEDGFLIVVLPKSTPKLIRPK